MGEKMKLIVNARLETYHGFVFCSYGEGSMIHTLGHIQKMFIFANFFSNNFKTINNDSNRLEIAYFSKEFDMVLKVNLNTQQLNIHILEHKIGHICGADITKFLQSYMDIQDMAWEKI